jgi:hypothetical protein
MGEQGVAVALSQLLQCSLNIMRLWQCIVWFHIWPLPFVFERILLVNLSISSNLINFCSCAFMSLVHNTDVNCSPLILFVGINVFKSSNRLVSQIREEIAPSHWRMRSLFCNSGCTTNDAVSDARWLIGMWCCIVSWLEKHFVLC